MMVIKLLLALLSVTTAQQNCLESRAFGDYFRGWALASQRNKTETAGDCYVKTDMAVGQYASWLGTCWDAAAYVAPRLFLNSMEPLDMMLLETLSYLDLLVPLKYGGSLAISLSDAMVACDVDQILQQMAFRLNTLAGRQDLWFVIISGSVGWMKEWFSFYNNPLYNALEPLIKSVLNFDDPDSPTMSCQALGFLAGSIPDIVLNYQAPDEVFFTSVDAYQFSALA